MSPKTRTFRVLFTARDSTILVRVVHDVAVFSGVTEILPVPGELEPMLTRVSVFVNAGGHLDIVG